MLNSLDEIGERYILNDNWFLQRLFIAGLLLVFDTFCWSNVLFIGIETGKNWIFINCPQMNKIKKTLK